MALIMPQEKSLHFTYTLGRRLGRGKFGATYLCTENATGKKYACKCIKKRNQKLEFETFKHEVRIMMHLVGHSNIVAIKDVYVEDSNYFHLVMELCDGGTLTKGIIHHGFYSEAKAAHLFKIIVEAVRTCHNKKIVHGDLKPDNILFATKHEDSTLKLADFGHSQFCWQGEVLKKIVGTPCYIAPEVLDGHYGPKADVWSLGVILYEMLSGEVLFLEETLEEIIRKIRKEEPPSFEFHPWPNISENAKDLIRQMLNHNPKSRPSPSEVLNHVWIQENFETFDAHYALDI